MIECKYLKNIWIEEGRKDRWMVKGVAPAHQNFLLFDLFSLSVALIAMNGEGGGGRRTWLISAVRLVREKAII